MSKGVAGCKELYNHWLALSNMMLGILRLQIFSVKGQTVNIWPRGHVQPLSHALHVLFKTEQAKP